MYKIEKLNSIFENYMVFRELNPVRKNLPQFEEIKRELHFERLPRKKDALYAEALGYIFKSIRDFKKVFYIGDTLLSDGAVIKNFAKSGLFYSFGIITREEGEEQIELRENFVFNTRWADLRKAIELAESKSFAIDSSTVFVIDIDKTAIGARGRNDSAIDKARTDAIFQLAGEIFERFDKDGFFSVYDKLNKKDYFYITSDNQDFVSILSMLIYGGAINFEELKAMSGIEEALCFAISRAKGALRKVAETVYKNVLSGNPTTFPSFRKAEFRKTIERMNFLPQNAPVSALLEEEILITGEVFSAAVYAKERGALVFGVSDKPALSTMPSGSVNLPPIFEKEMKVFGKY